MKVGVSACMHAMHAHKGLPACCHTHTHTHTAGAPTADAAPMVEAAAAEEEEEECSESEEEILMKEGSPLPDDNDDEEEEEEYRARYSGLSQRAALELVDPGGLDDVLRVSAGLRFGSR